MKREFLQNLKVGDQPLSKEVIDAIMAEHGRGIEAAKKPYEDYDTIKSQLADAQATLQNIQQNGQTIEAAQQEASEWERKYNDAVAAHQTQLENMAFDRSLADAIAGAKGKNAKAITALLDVDGLRKSKNRDADIAAALEALRTESGYLFEDNGGKPKFTTGNAGSGDPGGAGDLGKLSMADYIAARKK